MTRTDVMASGRPRTVGATSTQGSPRGRRRLLAVPIALVMAAALTLPGTALAAEGTSGYGSTPTTPTTTTKTTPTTPTATTPATEPKTGTSPSKEKSTPAETAPESKSTAPAAEKATSLPFTGLDLRWMIGIGVLLMGAGFSIVVMQRRQRRDGRR